MFIFSTTSWKLIILSIQFVYVYVVLLFAMILAAVKAKDAPVLEMLDFSEFLYAMFNTKHPSTCCLIQNVSIS